MLLLSLCNATVGAVLHMLQVQHQQDQCEQRSSVPAADAADTAWEGVQGAVLPHRQAGMACKCRGCCSHVRRVPCPQGWGRGGGEKDLHGAPLPFRQMRLLQYQNFDDEQDHLMHVGLYDLPEVAGL